LTRSLAKQRTLRDKVIAVSAAGFSEGARRSANRRGIEIRTQELILETPRGERKFFPNRSMASSSRRPSLEWSPDRRVPPNPESRVRDATGTKYVAHFRLEEGDRRLRVTLHVVEEGHFTVTIHPVEG
jgi:hypothetical protein